MGSACRGRAVRAAGGKRMSIPKTPRFAPEELKRLFSYDSATGTVTRVVARGGRPAGTVVGCLRPDGYLTVMVGKQLVLLHRVVWALVTGSWPVGVIDHENGERADNRWANLRETTQTGNMLNQHKSRGCAAGFPGVDVLPNGRYRARLFVRRRIRHLGVFDTASEAHAVYVSSKLHARLQEK